MSPSLPSEWWRPQLRACHGEHPKQYSSLDECDRGQLDSAIFTGSSIRIHPSPSLGYDADGISPLARAWATDSLFRPTPQVMMSNFRFSSRGVASSTHLQWHQASLLYIQQLPLHLATECRTNRLHAPSRLPRFDEKSHLPHVPGTRKRQWPHHCHHHHLSSVEYH